jgi:glycosyltransferase involved in cell wall biosynthesis
MRDRPKRVSTIAVNGRFLTQAITGVQRYAFELLRALDRMLDQELIPRIPVMVFVPPGASALPAYSFIKVREVGRLRGQLWEQVELPFYAGESLLFTPCGGAPVIHRFHVITIHDAGPFRTPRAYTAVYRTYYKMLQRYLASTAAHLLTVSEFSRGELLEVLRVQESKITCTYESGEHILAFPRDKGVLARHGLVEGQYAFAVSSANPNKNLTGLMEAATLLRPSGIQIAIAGGINSRIFSESEYPSDSVRRLGVVSDAELRTLYENAGCFVFPSFYEGFGLPPLEALTLGCPVVVSRISALQEIFGGAAAYCDPYSAADIAVQIQQAIGVNHGERDRRKAYAAHFTWGRCAKQTWAIFMKVMSGATDHGSR